MNTLRNAIVFLSCGYLLVAALLYVFQRHLQYIPANRGLTPQALGLSGVTIAAVTTADNAGINLWTSDLAEGRPVILFFHGNAGEVGDRTERLQFYRSHGFGVVFVSYRGYGGSSGSPAEAGLIEDGETALRWLAAQGIKPRDTFLVGESLGTGVVVQLAARGDFAGVALEAPFTSAAAVAALTYWWLPVSVLMKDQFRSDRFIQQVAEPLIVSHGDRDGLIPVRMGIELFELAPSPLKELNIIPGASHDAIFEEAVWEKEIAFFKRVLAQ